jgi:hypothetical protein
MPERPRPDLDRVREALEERDENVPEAPPIDEPEDDVPEDDGET